MIEVSALPPLVRISVAAEFLGYEVHDVHRAVNIYTARMDAYRDKHGHYPAHDAKEALPRDGEIAGKYLRAPRICSDGKRRGGSKRIYRDMLLYQLYGVLEYDHLAEREVVGA